MYAPHAPRVDPALSLSRRAVSDLSLFPALPSAFHCRRAKTLGSDPGEGENVRRDLERERTGQGLPEEAAGWAHGRESAVQGEEARPPAAAARAAQPAGGRGVPRASR